MIGTLILVGFLVGGVSLAFCLLPKRETSIRVWFGLMLGLVLAMWLPTVFAFFLTYSKTAVLCGLGVALLGSGALLFVRRSRLARVKGDFKREALFLLLVIPLLAFCGYLLYTHTLREVNGTLHVGQSTYGDLNMHMAFATSFQNATFPPEYNLLPGTQLGYPFLVDTLSTLLLLFDCNLAWSMILPSFLLMAVVFYGFCALSWEATHKKSAVALAFLFLFLNGGLGFLYTFDLSGSDSSGIQAALQGFYETPTNSLDHNLRWVNVICDLLIPQRTLLAGWAVVIPCLWLLLRAMRTRDRDEFLLLGAVAGLLPMIHTHSFLALGLISLGAMISQLIRAKGGERKRILTNFLAYGALAVVLALPQLFIWTFRQTGISGYPVFHFNWVNNDNGLIDGYLWFWVKNVGPLFLFFVPAALRADKENRGILLGALFVFIVAELVQFQRNVYDNNKLFYVAFICVLPATVSLLTEIFGRLKGLRCRYWLAGVFLAVCLTSGVVSLAREAVSDYELYSEAQVKAAEFVEENTERDATFLTAPDPHNNAIASLTGRKIVCGSGTFLYYHGLDYGQQRYAALQMLSDPAVNLDLFERYGVDYVCVNLDRSDYWDTDLSYFYQNCELIYDEGGILIFTAP